MTETELMRQIQLEASRQGARLFRNNCGMCITVDNRRIRFGVGGPGGSDLIGWSGGAIFIAIEVKSERGRVRPEQKAFIDAVRAAGGRAGVARSVDEAIQIIKGGNKMTYEEMSEKILSIARRFSPEHHPIEVIMSFVLDILQVLIKKDDKQITATFISPHNSGILLYFKDKEEIINFDKTIYLDGLAKSAREQH